MICVRHSKFLSDNFSCLRTIGIIWSVYIIYSVILPKRFSFVSNKCFQNVLTIFKSKSMCFCNMPRTKKTTFGTRNYKNFSDKILESRLFLFLKWNSIQVVLYVSGIQEVLQQNISDNLFYCKIVKTYLNHSFKYIDMQTCR